MPVMLQNVIVTIVALGAAAVFARRFFGASRKSTPSCPSCESGAPCAPTSAVRPAEPEVKPLKLLRPQGPR